MFRGAPQRTFEEGTTDEVSVAHSLGSTHRVASVRIDTERRSALYRVAPTDTSWCVTLLETW